MHLDIPSRRAAATLLRQFASGSMTNDEFEEQWPASTDPALAADGLRAEVELVVTSESTSSDSEWHFRTHGAGAMLLEPTTFGRVYVTDLPNTPGLVLVSRRSGRPS